MSCAHSERKFFKHPHAGGFHIVERCTSCGENPRGAGKWVSRAEVAEPSSLTVDPWMGRHTAPAQPARQPELFS